MIGLGICWASMVGVPYLMVASMVPREPHWRVHGHSQHDDRCSDARGNAHLRLDFQAPVGWKGHQRHIGRWYPARAAPRCAMLWVNPPHTSEESDFLPLGRHHISVYARLWSLVPDGTDASLYAVDRAHAVAAEADAHVLVVSAYNPGPPPTGEASSWRSTRALRQGGCSAAPCSAAIKYLTSDRRAQRRYSNGSPVDPAEALLGRRRFRPPGVLLWSGTAD